MRLAPAQSGVFLKITMNTEAFIHLVYEYRCLATAAYAWRIFGDPVRKGSHKDQANSLVPEIGTIIQDSLQLHTRSLIDFYWPVNLRPTDINISDFVAPDVSNYSELIELKKKIEVHTLHLTSWRDPQYREGGGNDVQRPNWNEENGKVFGWLTAALKETSIKVPDAWATALNSLYEASIERFDKGPDYTWPKELGERTDIESYLDKLGCS